MTNRVPTWFWVVAIIMLLWNLMGVMAFIGQISMTGDMLAELPQEQQDLFNSSPSWLNVAFGVAVIGGALGCIALLLKKKWAKPLFIISLIGVLVQNGYLWLATNAIDVYGAGQAIAMPALVIVFGVFLIWHSGESTRKGWLS